MEHPTTCYQKLFSRSLKLKFGCFLSKQKKNGLACIYSLEPFQNTQRAHKDEQNLWPLLETCCSHPDASAVDSLGLVEFVTHVIVSYNNHDKIYHKCNSIVVWTSFRNYTCINNLFVYNLSLIHARTHTHTQNLLCVCVQIDR